MTAQQLKNSILQLAVQGKLVPQDSSDEPASVLLQRIKAEKHNQDKPHEYQSDKSPILFNNIIDEIISVIDQDILIQMMDIHRHVFILCRINLEQDIQNRHQGCKRKNVKPLR